MTLRQDLDTALEKKQITFKEYNNFRKVLYFLLDYETSSIDDFLLFQKYKDELFIKTSKPINPSAYKED